MYIGTRINEKRNLKSQIIKVFKRLTDKISEFKKTI